MRDQAEFVALLAAILISGTQHSAEEGVLKAERLLQAAEHSERAKRTEEPNRD